MKILFVQPCYENFGGYFRALGMAKALSKKNIKVDLLCPNKDKFSLPVKKTLLRKHLTRYELPRWEINFFISGRIVRGLISAIFVLFGNYDIIHTFSTIQPESIIPFFVAKLLGKKVIFDWDDYWQDSPLYHNSSDLVKKYISLLENTIPRYSKHMTVTSEFLSQKAKSLGSGNVLKIINGIDLDQFSPIKKDLARKHLKIFSNEKIIFSFGNTYEGDRAYLLFKTFQEILKRDKTIKFYFKFDPKDFLKEKRIRKEINPEIFNNIIVTGYISDRELPYYIGACDLILFLTGETDNEKACFPIRIGSYLNGEKIIATCIVDTEAYNSLAKYDCIVNGKDPMDLAKKITDFFVNPQIKKNLSKNVLWAKSELNWDKITNNLVNYYETITR